MPCGAETTALALCRVLASSTGDEPPAVLAEAVCRALIEEDCCVAVRIGVINTADGTVQSLALAGETAEVWQMMEAKGISIRVAPPLESTVPLAAVTHILAAAVRAEALKDSIQKFAHAAAQTDLELQSLGHALAHELQEPVRTVSSFAGLIRIGNRAGLQEDDKEYIGFLESGARRLHSRLNALLRYFDLAAVHPVAAPITLGTLIDRVIGWEQEMIEGLGAVVHLDVEDAAIMADANLWVEALRAVLANALIFHAPGTPPKVAITARSDARNVSVIVSDNGIGMRAETASLALRPFYRERPELHPDGSGMGLSIAHRIMQRMGGSITFVRQDNGLQTILMAHA